MIGSGSVLFTLNGIDGQGDFDCSRTYGAVSVGKGKLGDSEVKLRLGVEGDSGDEG